MRIQAGLLSIAQAISVALVIFVTPGVAAADAESDARRWVPGISIFVAGLPEDRSAKSDHDATAASAAQEGESVGFPWSAGGEIGLASPVFMKSALKPRFTIHAGAGYVLDGSDPVSSVDDPGGPPLIVEANILEAAKNIGSSVRVRAKDWVLTGGFGVLFEFEAFERTVFLRPTVEWMYRRDTVTATLGLAEYEDPPDPLSPLCSSGAIPDKLCRSLYSDSQFERGYHSLGIGLEAELDGGRAGDFLVRMYASGRAYHILGDRKLEFSSGATWMTMDGSPTSRSSPTTTFSGRYEREPMHYRAAIGIRFLYMPE